MSYPDLATPESLRKALQRAGSGRELADALSCSPGTITAACRRHGFATMAEAMGSTSAAELEDADILRHLKERRTLAELADALDVAPKRVAAAVADLQSAGYNIVESGGYYWQDVVAAPTVESFNANPTQCERLHIAVVSDTHLGSKAQQLTHLRDFYRRIADAGITDVYHVGDLIDGEGLYRGHEHEVFVHGMDDQVAYAAAEYPRIEGIKTHLIGGNHDLVFVKRAGADPLVRVAAMRPDINYLGPWSRTLQLSPHCSLFMLHPDGGPAYARSYRLQKTAESFEGGSKPNVMVLGHWHMQCYLFVRNIHALLGMCFQAQTSYERRKALQPDVGGMILDIEMDDDGRIQRFVPEFVNYLVPKERDWRAAA